jgi:hypothetical protein
MEEKYCLLEEDNVKSIHIATSIDYVFYKGIFKFCGITAHYLWVAYSLGFQKVAMVY